MKKRNWLVLLLVGALAITSFNSCKKDEGTDDNTDTGPTEWEKTTVFDEDPRSGAATFTINKVAYLVGGYTKTDEVLKDAYSFDGKAWSPKAAFTGPARHKAVGFSVGGNGYVGLGYGGDGEDRTALKDFYKYTPGTNEWTKIADFPGEARFGAVAFTLGNTAYVGLGITSTDKTFSDFYKYEPGADKWTKITTNFTDKKGNAFAFVIGDKAYVGGGISNGVLSEDFYSFDGKDWTKEASLRTDNYDARRVNASSFAIGNNGYVVSGRTSSGFSSTVWKYDSSAKTWSDGSQSFPSSRENAIGFEIDGKGFISTGSASSSYFYDTYVFTPVR